MNDNNPSDFGMNNAYMNDQNAYDAQMNANQNFQNFPPNQNSNYASQAPAHASASVTSAPNVTPLNAPLIVTSVAGGGLSIQGMPPATTSMSSATTSTQAAPASHKRFKNYRVYF